MAMAIVEHVKAVPEGTDGHGVRRRLSCLILLKCSSSARQGLIIGIGGKITLRRGHCVIWKTPWSSPPVIDRQLVFALHQLHSAEPNTSLYATSSNRPLQMATQSESAAFVWLCGRSEVSPDADVIPDRQDLAAAMSCTCS